MFSYKGEQDFDETARSDNIIIELYMGLKLQHDDSVVRGDYSSEN